MKQRFFAVGVFLAWLIGLVCLGGAILLTVGFSYPDIALDTAESDVTPAMLESIVQGVQGLLQHHASHLLLVGELLFLSVFMMFTALMLQQARWGSGNKVLEGLGYVSNQLYGLSEEPEMVRIPLDPLEDDEGGAGRKPSGVPPRFGGCCCGNPSPRSYSAPSKPDAGPGPKVGGSCCGGPGVPGGAS